MDLFGGNSNWRGPIWFPINYLLIEALEKYHHFYGDAVKVAFPTGSRQEMNLREIADALGRRMIGLFLKEKQTGRRPYEGDGRASARRPEWEDLIAFHEYFDGDTDHGLGASHQTGWTALVARLMEKTAPAKQESPVTQEIPDRIREKAAASPTAGR